MKWAIILIRSVINKATATMSVGYVFFHRAKKRGPRGPWDGGAVRAQEALVDSSPTLD